MVTDLNTTSARLAALDYGIEAAGISADPVSLLLLAHEARDLGISELLVSLMIDEAQPEVARIRAYARVSVQVANRRSTRSFATAERELEPAC
ncbi:MAG: hypothetical protein NTX29_06570 [Actinobacteria bacterium]|nr:hypothetical protein [Actinomycetota bacterium]